MLKSVLISGSAKRIGKNLAEYLAKAGWHVAIHYNSSEHAAMALTKEILAQGGVAHCFQADLQKVNNLSSFMQNISEVMGPITLLINNASIFEHDTLDTLTPEAWEQHFSVNLAAPCFLAKAFAKQLPPEEAGQVINIIDQRVWKLTPQFFSYTLTKSALWTATQTMAQALAPRIRVNAIGPGPTLANERQSESDFKRQFSATLLRKAPELSEINKAVDFLINTPSITGQMVALDGGQHLAWQTPDVTNIVE